VLNENSGRACGFFAINLTPRPGFVRRLEKIAESVQKRLPDLIWNVQADKYLGRQLKDKYFYVFEQQRLYCQTLGLEPWTQRVDEHFSVMKEALEVMEVTEIKRIGFQVSCWLPIQMTHAEMVDLMYGSFLPNPAELEAVFGKTDDAMIMIYGSNRGIKSRTTICPQTAEQVSQTLPGIPNLELFTENKLIDLVIRNFRTGIESDSLYFEADQSQENLPVAGLKRFMTDSIEGAERLADGSVRYLRYLSPRRMQRYGIPQ